MLIGRNWDAAKNSFLQQIELIKSKPKSEYDRICREIEQKRQEQEREKQRVAAIKNGIEQNSIMFAQKISQCKTSAELTNIERSINLEKGRKEKYQEFIEEAVVKFNELNSLLAKQKIEVKRLEDIERQQQEAKEKQDEEKLIKLMEEKEQLETKIEENNILVQEAAINQTLDNKIETAETVIPQIKVKRTTIEFEVVDINETLKKNPDWVELTPNKENINIYLKQLKETSKEDIDVTVAGIRFYTKKTY